MSDPPAKLRLPSVMLLVGALALWVVYFSYTGPMLRNPDAGSHLAYVRFLLDKHAFPSASDCSVCHHPPLYYLGAAAVYRGCQGLGVTPERGTQLWSMALMALFAVTHALTVTRLFQRSYQQYLAIALVVFWPLSVLASARINNDVGFYAVAGLCFHFVVRFWQGPRPKWLALAAGMALLGLFVKATALVLVLLVLGVALAAWRRAPARRPVGRAGLAVLGALVVATALFGVLRGGAKASLPASVLGTAFKTAPKELDPRGAGYYLAFQPRHFVDVPYAETRIPKSHEPTFWNHWLKSSLFGTRNRFFGFSFEREPPSTRVIAGALNGLLLGLLAFAAVALWLSRRHAGPARGLCAGSAALFVAVALGFHALVPTGHHADFRFVYPVILPASALFADAVGGLRRRRLWLWHAGYLLTELVVAFSVAYFVAFLLAPVPH